MPRFEKDLVIPKELLNEFRVTVRVIDKKHLAGMWPVDARIQKIFQERFPRLYENDSILRNYDLAMVYKGRKLKSDLKKLHLDFEKLKIRDDIIINGIPVPWTILRKLNINHRRFDLIYTPKRG